MGWYRYIFVDILKMIEDGCMIRQDKIEPLHKIGVHIWEKGLADAIQTSFEGDSGCYNLAHVLNREKMVSHPFGIISADTAKGFDGRNLHWL